MMEGSSSNGGRRGTSPGRTTSVDGRLFGDGQLSVGARMLFCFLTALPQEADGTVRTDPLALAPFLGLAPLEVAKWTDELGQAGVVGVVERDPYSCLPVRVRLARNIAGTAPLSPHSMGDEFRLTMEALTIPENLQSYYAEIYTALKTCVSEYVRMENLDSLQRVVDRVSALMDEGAVDERGPAGLIVYICRKTASVPPRDFGMESRQTQAHQKCAEQVVHEQEEISEAMNWGPAGSSFDTLPDISGSTGHDGSAGEFVTLEN
jgi:hypothetical protein